jgi:hypothetical protein
MVDKICSNYSLDMLPTFGADPELFMALNDRVVGAEKVIPEEGIGHMKALGIAPLAVLDGVQVELHPAPSYCRVILGQNIAACFQVLEEFLKQNGKPHKPCFLPVIEVDEEEFGTLSPKSKALGCQPSLNVYGSSGVAVDPATYRWRSAGGHIHISFNTRDQFNKLRFPGWEQKSLEELVVLLDVLLGNTCVMLDRDPLASQRRKTYGMAGEHRRPVYGVEYRVLSNFWLRSYTLMSLVIGIARQAVILWNRGMSEEVLRLVDIAEVQKAINTNSFDGAKENFNRIKGFLAERFEFKKHGNYSFPLSDGAAIPLLEKVIERGLEEYFTKDPLEDWKGARGYGYGEQNGRTNYLGAPIYRSPGWDSFVTSQVK